VRIEIAPDETGGALNMEMASRADADLQAAGLQIRRLDLEGYRQGSLNEVLPVTIPVACPSVRELVGAGSECAASIASNAVQNLIKRFWYTKGFGSSLCTRELANGRLQLPDAADAPLRIRLLVSSANHRSTRFNHEPYVGVKCTWNAGA